MKSAIYIEDGVIQLIITPESDFEKGVVDSFADKKMNAEVFDGQFYACQGGWIRQKNDFGVENSNNNSLIIKAALKQNNVMQIYTRIMRIFALHLNHLKQTETKSGSNYY